MKGIALRLYAAEHGEVPRIEAIDPSTLRRTPFASYAPNREFVQVVDGNVVAEFDVGEIVLAPLGELP